MKLMKCAFIGLLMILSNSIIAQDNDRSARIEEMHERKWQNLITQAQLSPKEIENVKPIFLQYEKTLWKMHQENRDAFRAALRNAKNVKPNYADLNERYVNYQFKEAQLFKNYHIQLRKLLQPETLFKYYKAERDFKRVLLRDFQDHRQHDNH